MTEPNAQKTDFHPFTLKLYSKEDEKAYSRHHIKTSLIQYRIAIVSGILFFIALAVSDMFLFSRDTLKPLFIIRFGIAIPILVSVLIMSYRKFYISSAEIINTLLLILISFCALAISYFGRHEKDISRHFAGIIVVLIYIYTFFSLRFTLTFALGFSISSLYALQEIFIQKYPFPVTLLNLTLLLGCNFILMIVAYWLERYGKSDFIQKQLLQKMAIQDPLTGLKNRTYFYNFIKDDINRRILASSDHGTHKRINDENENGLGIIVLDVDFFKKINDTYGHQSGDMLLAEISRLLEQCTRKSDDVVRWGGEEFLIILKGICSSDVRRMVRKIGNAIQSHEFRLPTESVKITGSMGFTAVQPDKDFKLEDVINIVDKGLYKAKHSDRNKAFQVFAENNELKYEEILYSIGDTAN